MAEALNLAAERRFAGGDCSRSWPSAPSPPSGTATSSSTGLERGRSFAPRSCTSSHPLYAVGYMRLLGEDARLAALLCDVCRLRSEHAHRPVDEQRRPLLDRHRAHDADQHLSRRVRAQTRRASRPRGNTSSSSRPASASPCSEPCCSIGRHVRDRADLRHDLGGSAGRRPRASILSSCRWRSFSS